MPATASFSTVGFFNNIWPLNQTNWASYFAPSVSDGVMLGIGNEMEVTANGSGMQVYVKTGECRVRSHRGYLGSQATLAIDTANSTNPRWDLVVARVTYGTTSTMELAVKTGTPAASSPSVPAPTQTAGSVWEIPLAQVYVAAGAHSIASTDVRDRRFVYRAQMDSATAFSSTSVTLKNQRIFRNSSAVSSLTINVPAYVNDTFIAEVDFTSGSSFSGVVFKQAGSTITPKLGGDALTMVSKRYNIIVWWDGSYWWAAALAA